MIVLELPAESLADLERRLILAQGLLPHPDDRLFAPVVPAERRPGGM